MNGISLTHILINKYTIFCFKTEWNVGTIGKSFVKYSMVNLYKKRKNIDNILIYIEYCNQYVVCPLCEVQMLGFLF